MPWLTPNEAPSAVRRRCLFIPDTEEWEAIVQGALVDLIYSYNWEQFGLITPTEAAERAQTMFLEFLEGNCMIGTIMAYATSTAPYGYLECDGSTHQRTDYPLLYSLLDTAFIVDADNFVTPDLRGRTLVGAGSGPGLSSRSVNEDGGEEEHTLSVGEMPSHQHQTYLLQDAKRLGVNELANIVFGNIVSNPAMATDLSGGDGSHNNMQPFVALKYGILAK